MAVRAVLPHNESDRLSGGGLRSGIQGEKREFRIICRGAEDDASIIGENRGARLLLNNMRDRSYARVQRRFSARRAPAYREVTKIRRRHETVDGAYIDKLLPTSLLYR